MEILTTIDATGLKRVRKSKSWSQEHLANAAGLSLRTVQRIESTGSASSESMLALAAALNVPVESLINMPQLERFDVPQQTFGRQHRSLWAYGGIATGALGTAVCIVCFYSSGKEIGVALGTLGAVTGLICAFIGAFTQRCTPAIRTGD